MDFWKTLDHILDSHEIVIDRPQGSAHPKVSDMIYPFDYGYLKGTSSGDGNEIDVCKGTLRKNQLVAIICTVDINKQDTEVKLLVDRTDTEIAIIDRFFNRQKFGGGLVIRRNI